ncbi:exo 1,3/1,4-beta-D-glucan glucohydrolase [Permianibacter sp. IMCC34836]|uniref:glycoside hydrolase family 3 protein n=1 Tax=Permianibacter fluminis TaxID=2738515 RepID=UPI001557D7EF|nr:glycoside hydrolase family 3 protein [Permianibacter fluminis]NQD37330.1 exo 1,3/1,4-beta-D-glucan glucohydrolase [Permianibacter fluminis]
MRKNSLKIAPSRKPKSRVSLALAWVLAGYAAMVTLGHAAGSGSAPSDGQVQGQIQLNNWPQQHSPLPRDAATEARITRLLQQMTLEEKVGQIIQADIDSVTPDEVRRYHLGSVLNGGNSAPNQDNRAHPREWLKLADAFWAASTDRQGGRTGIPVMWGTDAVHGQSKIVGATLFPHNIGLGAANDPALIRRIGEITAKEILVTGQDWTFAPTLAVARNDRWGRSYESYSENPELVGRYAGAIIEGLQGKLGTPDYLGPDHLLATAKHFVGDGGTADGIDTGNNLSSEAALRDIHAAGYPPAIAAGAQVVMASFNSWHGQKMHGNKTLLTDVLVGRLGFDGFVVGDWNGHALVPGCSENQCAAAVTAGLDMFMAPNTWKGLYETTLAQARSGELPLARLDEAVSRILRVKIRMGLLDQVPPSQRKYAGKYELLGAPAHRAVAREAARKSMVLLKNNRALLPLKPGSKILITGDGADNIGKQCGGWTLTWQGLGNRNEHFPHGESIYQGLQHALIGSGGTVQWSDDGSYDSKPDVAIVVFGEDPYAEFQGDRPHLDFSDDSALQMLKRFRQAGIPTVAVFLSGRPLWVNPELNQSDAFIAAFLPGTEGGALADLLLQKPDGSVGYDFSGKLSFSWPNDATGRELNVGDADYQPLFAYGYGLSYQDKRTVATVSENAGLNLTSNDNGSRYLIAGKAVAPWQLQLIDGDKITVVENATQVSSLGAVTARAADRKQQEDTVIIDVRSKSLIALSHGQDRSIDLVENSNAGMALELEYRVLASAGQPARIGLACGTSCSRFIEVGPALKQQVGTDWHTASIPLACFAKAQQETGNMKMNHITSPFVFASDGAVQLQLARVQLKPVSADAVCGLK